jgi:hypothetical protein
MDATRMLMIETLYEFSSNWGVRDRGVGMFCIVGGREKRYKFVRMKKRKGIFLEI